MKYVLVLVIGVLLLDAGLLGVCKSSTPSNIQPESRDPQEWRGVYEFEESAPGAQNWLYKFYVGGDKPIKVWIEVDGFQTLYRFGAVGEPHGDKLDVKLVEKGPECFYCEKFTAGDLLATLVKKKSKVILRFGKMSSNLKLQSIDGKVSPIPFGFRNTWLRGQGAAPRPPSPAPTP